MLESFGKGAYFCSKTVYVIQIWIVTNHCHSFQQYKSLLVFGRTLKSINLCVDFICFFLRMPHFVPPQMFAMSSGYLWAPCRVRHSLLRGFVQRKGKLSSTAGQGSQWARSFGGMDEAAEVTAAICCIPHPATFCCCLLLFVCFFFLS